MSSPAVRPWNDYRTIMWIGDTAYKKPEKLPLFFQRLREMGVNTGMVHGEGDCQPFVKNNFPYYVENLVNRGLCLKWNSKVRDWDKFVTEWTKTGRPETNLVRDYCLDDPQWRDWARKEVQTIVTKNREHHPLAYNLRDELSTTISANPFDYDFNPLALAGFRAWLQQQYADLAALNAEWETSFSRWEEVKPFTTDEIKNRMTSGETQPRGKPDWQQLQKVRFDPASARQLPTHWNFAPWADFRTYMDLSLARALAELRRAAQELDPLTPIGIEGTQMPHAFGGFDLWRLAGVLDWVEPYDIGNAREIFGSFMPGKPFVTTVFETDTNHALRRLWHLMLEGDRGCIIWWSEDCIDWKSDDYQLTAKGKALAPALAEMTSPLARLFLRAERQRDPIYLHYSQASLQVDWLLESTVDGSTWVRRFSSFEAEHNRMAKVRNGWLKAFQDLGCSPQFISSEQIEAGVLRKLSNAVLVLPSSWAMSDKELLELNEFVDSSGTVFADGTPGQFDAHGKLRATTPGIFRSFASTNAPVTALNKNGPAFQPTDVANYPAARLKSHDNMDLPEWISAQLKSLSPEISVPLGVRARVHRFRVRRGEVLAIERNVDYHMSEDLKQAGGNDLLEKSVETEATLPHPMHIYDLRSGKYLGHTNRFSFTLLPWHPSLFGMTKQKVTAEPPIEAFGK
jgi:hypothetical protein